jgi:hypothetical protein
MLELVTDSDSEDDTPEDPNMPELCDSEDDINMPELVLSRDSEEYTGSDPEGVTDMPTLVAPSPWLVEAEGDFPLYGRVRPGSIGTGPLPRVLRMVVDGGTENRTREFYSFLANQEFYTEVHITRIPANGMANYAHTSEVFAAVRGERVVHRNYWEGERRTYERMFDESNFDS